LLETGKTLRSPGLGWENNITTDFIEFVCRNMTAFIWLKMGSCGGFLWKQQYSPENVWVADSCPSWRWWWWWWWWRW